MNKNNYSLVEKIFDLYLVPHIHNLRGKIGKIFTACITLQKMVIYIMYHADCIDLCQVSPPQKKIYVSYEILQSVTGSTPLLMGGSTRILTVYIQPVPSCLGRMSAARRRRGCGKCIYYYH